VLKKVNTKADRKIKYIVIPQSALAFTLDLLLKDNPNAKITRQAKPTKG